MYHKHFSVTLFFLLGAGFIFSFGCRQSPRVGHQHSFLHNHEATKPTPVPDQIILNLSEDPLHKLAVNWRTDTSISVGEVQVARSSHGPEFREQYRTVVASSQRFRHQYESEPEVNAYYHEVMIDSLMPSEKYVYRVGTDTLWSEWFQVVMPNEQKVSLIYFGDAQNDVKSMWSRVIRQAYSQFPQVDFLLHAGDLINRSDRDLEWSDWFYAGGFIHAMIPSVMTPGNHEYGKEGDLSPQWKPQFNLPKNGPSGLEETCYFIDYPLVKVISLDAEQIDESTYYRDLQKSWLDSLLKINQAPWVVVTLHYPVFSTKPERDNVELRAHFKPIFDQYGVDIVLQGHDHAYGRGMAANVADGQNTRDQKSGTMYVVSISGPKMYDVTDASWMDRRAANTQLFQFISIERDQLNYQAFTARGDLYDEFKLLKNPDGPNKLINKIPAMPERVEELIN
ncbi:MAG: metallophosphoesterase family protein [Saprospiraceae bacterium]|nr:metallophosphoesterase family protein [Saprospiraceae bacterium]